MTDREVRSEEESSPRASKTLSPTPLGSWLRRARFDQQISQTELASRAGLSRSYVCNIERGYDIRPSISALDRLGGALGATRAEILAAAGILEPAAGSAEGEREERFLTVVRSLNDDDRELVERFARFLQSEERRWSQPRLIGEPDLEEQHFPQQSGPTLFDITTFRKEGTTD
jgi:transcriptional regulator with XRE-family HTH domain